MSSTTNDAMEMIETMKKTNIITIVIITKYQERQIIIGLHHDQLDMIINIIVNIIKITSKYINKLFCYSITQINHMFPTAINIIIDMDFFAPLPYSSTDLL